MRVIEAVADSAPARWVRGWSERQIEIAFGASLMLFVVLLLAAGELAARIHDGVRAPAGFDWFALMETMEPGTGDGPPRFRPDTTVGNIHINNVGFRGPDIAIDKPDGTIRLAFLGDSKIINAEYAEDQMVAAATVRALNARLPACRFDHVTIAGPAYRMEDLARIVARDGAMLDPDAYILLSGSMRDAIGLHAAANQQATHVADYPALGHHFRLWDKLHRAFHLARQERMARQRGPLADEDLAEIAMAIAEPAGRLATATAGTPLLAIGYRGQLREGQRLDAQMAHTRQLRMETQGLGAVDMARLNTLLVAAQQRAARRHGWTFVDPIADITPVAANFSDQSHFSRQGIAQLADAVADALIPMLAGQGLACLAVASG